MRKVYVDELKTSIVYEITSDKKQIEDSGVIQVYGIDVHREGSQAFYHDEERCQIEDISSECSYVIDLVTYLADHAALPEHIFDIVIDYISIV